MKPSQDSWYNQPSNISKYELGEIIRSCYVGNRVSPGHGSPDLTVKAIYQYLYRTTDSLGNPVGAAATIIISQNASPNKLLVYQLAYDTANPDCEPSYTFFPATPIPYRP